MNRSFMFFAAPAAAMVGALVLQTQLLSSQTLQLPARDPGVRAEPAGAGGPLAELTANQRHFFEIGKEDFSEAEEADEGLGPRMNLDGCGGCHIQPAIGGSSPRVNPQVAFANEARNRVPSFIQLDGPIREARFVRNRDGSPDGGVTSLFTISGRPDAPNCHLEQPDFEAAVARRNVVFRIPTPVFGAGLIEQIEDSTIVANGQANAPTKRGFGIRGRPNIAVSGRTISGVGNTNGNDGTVTRFGWKAQNVSLLLFSGEAYNVEMGITSELFPNEREQDPSCYFAPMPNDTQDMDAQTAFEGVTAIQNFANFQRFLAPPTPSTDRPGGRASIARGRQAFEGTGCALCHTPSLNTGHSSVAALREKPVNLFSDLLVHDMGDGLADGVTQGQAGPREFRTAPLWGLGQRIFFLHDGRTSDLSQAIEAHRSNGSEANEVTRRFKELRESTKQDLLNFLRSL